MWSLHSILSVRRSLLCCLLIVFSAGPVWAQDYYVDGTSGSDTNAGTSSGAAFKTIQKAASVATAGSTVLIKGGTYREVVTPTNSGVSGSPITFRNYQSEVATLSGADPLGSLTWTREGATSIYSATVPAGLLTLGNQNQLFADGRPLVLARWPNVGADLDLTRPGLSRIVTKAGQSGPASTLYTMTVTDPTLPNQNWTGALMGVSGWLTSPWGAAKVIGSSANTLTIQVRPSNDDPGTLPVGETVTGAHDGSRYWLSGISAALDAAGEWYFNPTTRVLRVWLPTGDSPASHGLEVRANRPWAFDLNQRSYITVSGLGFVATSLRTESFPVGNELYAAVFNPSAPRSRNVILQDLTFSQVFHADSADTDGGAFNPQDTYRFGAYNSGVILAGTAHMMRRCLIDGSAGHGLVVLGDGHVVEDNVIRNTALLGFENSAITLGDLGLYSKHHSIRFNTLFDSGNYLIRFYAGQSCLIHHNDAWSGKNLVTDGGCIYTWGSNGSDGTNRTEVAYNRVHDGYTEGYGAQGIYLDEGGTSNYIVHHNVAWNLNTGMAVNGVGGSNIDFVHNTLASGIAGDTPMRVVKIDATGNAVRNNLVQSMIHQDEFGSNTPDPILDKNLIGSTDALQLPAQTAPAFVISSNPLFTSPGVQDYTLQVGSPAVNAGSATEVAVRVQADGSELTVAANGTYVGAPDIGAYERGQPVWTAGTRITSLMTTANPTGLNASSSVVSTVVLNWTAPAPLPSGGMLLIERKLGEHFIEVGRVASAATTFTETSLLPGTWSYRVRTTAGGTSNIATVSTLAVGRNASGPIRATSYNALNDVGGAMNFDTVNGIVASPSNGDWLRYDNINFGAIGSYISVTARYGTDGISAIEIRLDDPNTGTLLTKMSLAGAGWSGTSSTAPIVATSGSHALYVKFVIPDGQASFFPCNLFSLAFNLVAAPVGPATCSATATSTSTITLTWSDTASNETGYRVERSADGLWYAQIADLAAGSTTYGDSGLTPATSYWYRVRAVNAGGYSAWSPVASAVTASLIPVTTYTITATAGSNGTVTPAGVTNVASGGSQTYTITPNAGYQIASLTVDGSAVTAAGTYTFTNVTANHTIAATFSVAAVSSLIAGDDFNSYTNGSFAATADPAYNGGSGWASGWSGDTSSGGAGQIVAGGVNGTGTGSHVATYGWTLIQRQLAAATSGEVWISFQLQGTNLQTSSGNVNYVEFLNGGTQAFYLNTQAGTAGTRPWRMTYAGGATTVADDLSHLVMIQMDPTANVARVWFDPSAASQPLSAAATSSTTLGSTAFDRISIRAASGSPMATLAMDDLRIAGSWAALSGTVSYAITASTGANGTVTPVGATTVTSGGNQTYTITPDSGYQIASLTVDGATVTIASSYTFSNVTANHTIAATFSLTPATTYTITATSGTNGTVTPAGTTTVSSGGSQTYAITPATGYQIASLTVDGSAVTIASSYAFTNVTANHTIAATFSLTPVTTYTVTGVVTVGGTGLAGVTVSDGTRSAVTDGSGTYILTGVPAGTYVVTPSIAGYIFSPASTTITVSGTTTVAQVFTGTSTSGSLGTVQVVGGNAGGGCGAGLGALLLCGLCLGLAGLRRRR